MTRLNLRLFWSFWLVLALGWLVVNPGVFSSDNFFALRNNLVQLSGFLGFSAMSVAMILALRLGWLEKMLGGLDRVYRFHKWIGIGALCVAVVHWLWAQGPKWAVEAGWLARSVRGPRPEITDPVQSFLRGLRHTGEGVGEWAFYLIAILLLVALVKFVPYRLFRYSHRLVPAAYLALVFHAVVCIDYNLWATPVGWVVAVLAAFGSYAAIVSLFGRIGEKRRVGGEIVSLNYRSGVKSLDAEVQMAPGWPGHKAGQFAFVTSNRAEGAHPYTIASAWNPSSRKLRFIARELGDHTTGLAHRLRPGHALTVEGPYGCFTFQDRLERQIWIGGGIGVTPFIARMGEMAANSGAACPEVDLFFCTNDVDEDAFNQLTACAAAAGVRLHLRIDRRDGLLSGDHIRQTVPGWAEASIWFCGPDGFGRALRRDFSQNGFPVEQHFHREFFEMR